MCEYEKTCWCLVTKCFFATNVHLVQKRGFSHNASCSEMRCDRACRSFSVLRACARALFCACSAASLRNCAFRFHAICGVFKSPVVRYHAICGVFNAKCPLPTLCGVFAPRFRYAICGVFMRPDVRYHGIYSMHFTLCTSLYALQSMLLCQGAPHGRTLRDAFGKKNHPQKTLNPKHLKH